MQKKSLLVALFCGALCLTGCLKNEESASVAQVRIAKANELNSIADLNKAKAAAEAVYAQAELTVANAEAKLREANAALVLAQAETEKVRAELLKVRVALAEVKVDEEKVKLLELEAELEQKLAEVEAAVAKAEAEKQGWINLLEHAIAAAEAQAITDAQAILEAEQALEAAVLKMEKAQADSAKKAADRYFIALNNVQKLEKELIETKAMKALVEAGAIEVRDAIYEQIDKIDEKIAEKDALVKYLKKYQTMTPEQAEEALMDARTALNEAYNKYRAAMDVKDAAKYALNGNPQKGITGLKNMDADYVAGYWKEGDNKFKDEFKEYVGDEWHLGTSDIFSGSHKQIDGVKYFGVFVADEDDDKTNDVFIPLWTSLKKGNTYYKWAAAKTTDERYPDIDVYEGENTDFIKLTNTTYVPAKIEFDNVEEVLDGLVEEWKAFYANLDKVYEEETIPGQIKDADEKIAEINDTLPLHQAYVAERKAAVTAAETAYLKAVSDAAKSKADKEKAWNDFQNYMLKKYDVSRELFEQRWAMQEKDANAASDTVTANSNLVGAEQAVVLAESNLKKAIEAEAKAEGAYRSATDPDAIAADIKNAWETAQQKYNPNFDANEKFVEDGEDYYNVKADGTTPDPDKKALDKQKLLAQAIVALEAAKKTEAEQQELKWRGRGNTYDTAVRNREEAAQAVSTAERNVEASARNYNAAKKAYDDALKPSEEASKAFNPNYAKDGDNLSVGYADQSVNGSTDHKYKEVTIEGQKVKAWVNGGQIAGTAQAERDTAWTKLRDAKKQLTVREGVNLAYNANPVPTATTHTVAEIAVYKKNVSDHWHTELATANQKLATALGVKKLEDSFDDEAKALYATYTAAVEKDETATKRKALQDAYDLFNPDLIAEYVNKTNPDGTVGNNIYDGNNKKATEEEKIAQYSWLLSSYHVDYEATMIDFETNEYVPIAAVLFGYLVDDDNEPIVDEDGNKIPDYTLSLAYQLEAWNAWKASTPKLIADFKADNANKLKRDIEDFQKLATKINSFAAHEDNYLSWIESLNAADVALNKAKKAEFDAKLVKNDAQAKYDAAEAVANEGMWVYDPDAKLYMKIYKAETKPTAKVAGEWEDGFTWITISKAIEKIEGEVKSLDTGVSALFKIATAAQTEYDKAFKDEKLDITDIKNAYDALSDKNMALPSGSIAELNFTKKVLEQVLKVGKVGLQIIVDAFDEEIAELNEKIDVNTAIANMYKAIMNYYLGIEENGETAPVDGEGEGDDEE